MITSENIGDRPFVLVELVQDLNEPAGFRMDIRCGGGVNGADYVGAILRLAANSFPKEPSGDVT